MGKHFDTLVEKLKKPLPPSSVPFGFKNANSYVCSRVRDAALFEFDIPSKEVFPLTHTDMDEHHQYLFEYLKISEEHGKFLIQPYENVAIEDLDTIVLVEEQPETNLHRVISWLHTTVQNGSSSYTWETLEIGDVVFRGMTDSRLNWGGVPLYLAAWVDKEPVDVTKLVAPEKLAYTTSRNLISGAQAYVQEMVYIMDPANFIIEAKSKQCIQTEQRIARGKGCHFIPKTCMRPTYKIRSHEDTKEFLKGQNENLLPYHSVRGHWRRVGKKESALAPKKKQFIPQYWRGNSEIQGKHGITYQVIVKKSLTEVVPASQLVGQ